MRLPSRVLEAKVYGPTLYKDRRYVTIEYDSGTKASMTYARFLMQEHLGRKLDPVTETVDHKDDDRLNDRIENFQLLTVSHNAIKEHGLPEMYDFICPMCDQPAEKLARMVRHNWDLGKAGPFCGRVCAGRWNALHQYGYM